MIDTITVHFTKSLINGLLADADPKTIRLESMGVANPDGSYTPTWVVEDMDPQLPSPWVFDGYRRVYDNGKVLGLWQARAINLTDVEIEKGTGRQKASFVAGQGKTMVEARDAMLEQLRPDPEQIRRSMREMR